MDILYDTINYNLPEFESKVIENTILYLRKYHKRDGLIEHIKYTPWKDYELFYFEDFNLTINGDTTKITFEDKNGYINVNILFSEIKISEGGMFGDLSDEKYTESHIECTKEGLKIFDAKNCTQTTYKRNTKMEYTDKLSDILIY